MGFSRLSFKASLEAHSTSMGREKITRSVSTLAINGISKVYLVETAL